MGIATPTAWARDDVLRRGLAMTFSYAPCDDTSYTDNMEITLLSLICFMASAIGTVTGFGTVIIMTPLLLIYYPLHEIIYFAAILHFVNGLTRLILFRQGFDLRLILSFGLAGFVASFAGASLAFKVSELALIQFTAVFLTSYSIYLLFNPKFKLAFNPIVGAASGAASGFVAGLCGMGGAIRAAFLATFDLPKAVYLANSALMMVLVDTSRLAAYISQGASFSAIATPQLLIVYILVSILGVRSGEFLVRRIPQSLFRYCVASLLLLLGLKLCYDSFL